MNDIVDRIYEAAVIPDLWIDILDRIAAIARCDGGILIAADPDQNVRAVSSDCLSPMLRAFIDEGWMRQNIRASRLAPLNYSGFVVDLDLVTPEEAETDPFYVDCLRKFGGGVGTGTVIPAPSGDLIIFNIERSHKKGFVDREVLPVLDTLRPHLARSALLAVRLGLERARAMTETLSKLALPGAALDANGRVLSANLLLEQMGAQFKSAAGGRLIISHHRSHDLFRAALEALGGRDAEARAYSFPVPANGDGPACVAHMLPVRRQARDIFSGASSVFVVTPLTNAKAPPAHVLNGLFDLSPAEAKVARGLVEGSSIEQIAKHSNLSRETVRNQLKSVLAKTGTGRQAELVSFLTSVHIGRS
ncbi:helix-turn-helix transcriptional regulator [Bradyrhizobium sp. UFLA05-112]